VRLGNLRGVLGKSADEWGLAAGTNLSDSTTAARYFVASDVTGLRLQNLDADIYSGAERVISLNRTYGLELLATTGHKRQRAVTFHRADLLPVASIQTTTFGDLISMQMGVAPDYSTSGLMHVTGIEILHETSSNTKYINLTASQIVTNGAFYAGDGMETSGTLRLREDTGGLMHGMTDLALPSEYGHLRPVNSSDGGLKIDGFTEQQIGVHVRGFASAVSNSTTAAPIYLNGLLKAGAGAGPVTSGNLMAVANNGAAKFIIKYDGAIYTDATSTVFTYDAYDDPALLRALSRELDPAGVIQSEWDKFVDYNRADLERAGILDGSMVNQTALTRLLIGAVWQLSGRIQTLEARPN